LRVLTGHAGLVNGVAFSPDGARIATASTDGTARIWQADTGEHLTTLQGHTNPVNGVAFSPDGARIATASHDGTVRIWQTTTGRQLVTLLPLGSDGYAALLPDGRYKLRGDPGDTVWWAIKLVCFRLDELDRYFDSVLRLHEDEPILPPVIPIVQQ
jgi:WD40 repeat protein